MVEISARGEKKKKSKVTRARDVAAEEELSTMEVSEEESRGIQVKNPDAVALVLIGIAIVLAATVWFGVAGMKYDTSLVMTRARRGAACSPAF